MKKKGIHEEFARFLEQPTRDKFRELVKNSLGEFDNLDYKEDWSDFSKIGKHILAMANSGGGCILLGISQEENGKIITKGLEKVIDKANINNGLSKFLPKLLKYEILDFHFEGAEYKNIENKSFQVILIEDHPEHIPFVSVADGSDISKHKIYIRNGTKSEEPNYEKLQALLNRRISTNFSTDSEIKLEEHFSQLKVLFGQIEKGKYKYEYENSEFYELVSGLAFGLKTLGRQVKSSEFVKNDKYPSEDFDDFVVRMIEVKKKRIESIIMK